MTSEHLIRDLVTDLRPVRRLAGARSRTLRWLFGSVLCVLCGVVVFGARTDLGSQLRHGRYLRESATLLLLVVVTARCAFELSVPRLLRDSRGQLAAWVLVAWFVQVALAPAPAGTDPLTRAEFWISGLACMRHTASLALAPAIAIVCLLRRAAPLEHGWAGFFAALSATSLATFGTQAVCSKDDRWHVLIWHVGPVLLAAFAGITLGRLLLRRTREVC